MRRFFLTISFSLIMVFIKCDCDKDNPISPQSKTMIRAAIEWPGGFPNFPAYESEPVFLTLSADTSFFLLSTEEMENYKNDADWYIDLDNANVNESIEGIPYTVNKYKDFKLQQGDYYYLLKLKFLRGKKNSFFWKSHNPLNIKDGKNTLLIHLFQDIGIGVMPPSVGIHQP